MSLLLGTHGCFPKVVAMSDKLGQDVHLLPGDLSRNSLSVDNYARACCTYQDCYRVADRTHKPDF